jgi:hypothetical protein
MSLLLQGALAQQGSVTGRQTGIVGRGGSTRTLRACQTWETRQQNSDCELASTSNGASARM